MTSPLTFQPRRDDPEKLVPYDTEAEEALLGSVLLDPDAIERVAPIVTPADFYREKNRWTFEAVVSLHRRREAIDFITVRAELERMGRVDDVGGPAFLASLLNAVPTSIHAEHYAGIVASHALRRRILAYTSEIARQTYDAEDVGELLRDAQDRLDFIRDSSSTVAVDPWQAQAFTVGDLYTERPPRTYAVTGLLTHGSLNMVYSAPGSMKSMVLADLAVCVALGRPWLPSLDGRLPGRRTSPSPVVWLDFDNGKDETLDRFEAFCRAYSAPTDTPLFLYSMPSPWLDATNPTAVDALIERIQRHRAGLVIVDTLGNVKGDADENTADMGRVMSSFRRLAEKTGAAVVLIHHQRKSNGTGGRAGDALRGHSSIEAALDLSLLIEREDGSSTAHIHATKARGPQVEPFGVLFAFEPKDDHRLKSARMFGLAVENEGSDDYLDKLIVQLVTDAHNSGTPLNQTHLVAAVRATECKAGVNRIRDRVKVLVSQGRLLCVKGKTGTADTYGPLKS